MNENLSAFLESRELDNLMALREKIPLLTAEDHEAIVQLLDNGSEYQAIANLLMYPQLIPEMERYQVLIKGLRETKNTYLVLASLVGLHDIPSEVFSEPVGKTIIKEIVRVLHQSDGVIAERASIFLAERLWYLDYTIMPEIIELIDHHSDIVRHNTLVALIPLVGLKNLQEVMAEAVEKGWVSAQGQIDTEKKLSAIRGFNKDGSVVEDEFDLGMLGTPLLAYIPNFDEWQDDLAT